MQYERIVKRWNWFLQKKYSFQFFYLEKKNFNIHFLLCILAHEMGFKQRLCKHLPLSFTRVNEQSVVCCVASSFHISDLNSFCKSFGAEEKKTNTVKFHSKLNKCVEKLNWKLLGILFKTTTPQKHSRVPATLLQKKKLSWPRNFRIFITFYVEPKMTTKKQNHSSNPKF